MPTKIEKDSVSQQETTGHEWDGIKELNTPLPKWWLYVFYATIIFSFGYMILYPSVPFVNDYFKGTLNHSQRQILEQKMEVARAERAVSTERFASLTPVEIESDPELLKLALAGGRTAFADNCVPCHGAGGAGAPGYPSLADDDWLWGGTLDDIHATIQHGIRWGEDADTRSSQMPSFGKDGLLDEMAINDVTEFILSLSGRETDQGAVKKGSTIFAENCAACHGEDGGGGREVGAPKLNDAIWLYGGDKETILEIVAKARGGVMPAWNTRLDPVTVKKLAVYVHSLGGGE